MTTSASVQPLICDAMNGTLKNGRPGGCGDQIWSWTCLDDRSSSLSGSSASWGKYCLHIGRYQHVVWCGVIEGSGCRCGLLLLTDRSRRWVARRKFQGAAG